MQLAKNEKMTIHGSGENTRTFIHARDVARAIEVILFKGEIGKIYNIGTDNEFSVLEIAENLYEYIYH